MCVLYSSAITWSNNYKSVILCLVWSCCMYMYVWFFDRNFLHHSSLQSIFITRIAQGGLAEQDGRLRLGDKLISVSKTRVQSNILSSWNDHMGDFLCSKCINNSQSEEQTEIERQERNANSLEAMSTKPCVHRITRNSVFNVFTVGPISSLLN